MKNISEYRGDAKRLMKGNYTNLWLLLIIFSVILSVFSGLSAGFSPTRGANFEIINPGNPGLSSLFNFLTFIASAYIGYSSLKAFIRITQSSKLDYQELILTGFKEQPIKIPLVRFLGNIFIFLWALLFIIPGVIKYYAYSLNMYLLIQEQSIEVTDVLKKSESIMYGKKMKLFMLDLSYFGEYLLGLFTFGIYLIWVIPRHQTARTLFIVDAYQAQ
jgi:uncharacterized membrane protein